VKIRTFLDSMGLLNGNCTEFYEEKVLCMLELSDSNTWQFSSNVSAIAMWHAVNLVSP
jgi:hypothetical protein